MPQGPSKGARPSKSASGIPRAGLKFGSIIVPIDFSDSSQRALDYAVRVAEQFGAKLILLHVVEPVATPDFAKSPLDLIAR